MELSSGRWGTYVLAARIPWAIRVATFAVGASGVGILRMADRARVGSSCLDLLQELLLPHLELISQAVVLSPDGCSLILTGLL